LRARLSKLPDLEKLLAKIFTYSIKHSVDAIYFEDVSLNKMKEFRQLLNCFKAMDETIGDLARVKNSFNSTRLKSLLSLETEGGLIPANIDEALLEFEKLIVWKVVQGQDKKIEIPEPQVGIDETFDQANATIDSIKEQLN
jgi:hypothetical protein